MKLEIVSASEHSSYQIAWLELNTPAGNFIIQMGHAPTILALTPNKPIKFRLKSGKQKSIDAYHGIARISRESTLIVLETSPDN